MRVVLGIGCDRGVSQETLAHAVTQALARVGLTDQAVLALATVDAKRDELELLALAGRHGWPLYFFSPNRLAEIDVPNPSKVVHRHLGTPAVAEAAALAAAEAGAEALLLPKQKYRGADGKHATVAVARANGDG
nr:cobalamin biosynthesis protein [Gammaproteobacteria bacterium]